MIDLVKYNEAVQELWTHIEDVIDEREFYDLDCFTIGSVFTVENGEKKQIIVSRQEPKLELWLASELGAYHFKLEEDGNWYSTTEHKNFYEYFDLALVFLGAEASFEKHYK